MKKTLVIYFSHSGNNRLLARELARRLECDLSPVVEKKRRTTLTILLDMFLRRKPAVSPLGHDPADYQHVVLSSPLWDSKVATPMVSTLEREKDSFSSYCFITFCGYDRDGQKEAVTRQLTEIVGHEPRAVCEFMVTELLAEEDKGNIKKVAGYRVAAEDLDFFDAKICDFCESIDADGS